jgi:hypothetical protein
VNQIPFRSDVAVFASIAAGVGGRTVADAALGYAESPVATRSVWAASSSFAGTVLLSRVGNHVRENGRRSPTSRAAGRLVKRSFSSNEMRIHHYLPSIAVGFAAGGLALPTHHDSRSPWLASVYGIGVGLTADELRVLANRSDPYWGGQHFALLQAAAAGCVSIGVALRFVRTGRARREREVPLPPSPSARDEDSYRAHGNGYTAVQVEIQTS